MKKFWQNEVVWISIAVIATIPLTASPKNHFDRVSQYDFDKDGKVSFEDINRYCTVPKTLFDRADKNGDGYLSNAEMRTAKDYLFDKCMNYNKNV